LADIGEAPTHSTERPDYVLKHPGSVDLIAASYPRNQVHRLDEQYDRVSSTLLLAAAGQLYGQTMFLREHAASGRVGQELRKGQDRTGYTHGPVGLGRLAAPRPQRDHRLLRPGHCRGQAHARRGGRRPCRTDKINVALYGTANPHEGLALASRAATVAEHDNHVLAGLASLHVGEAYAMLQDDRGCGETRGQADAHFAQITADDPAAALFCASHHGRLAGSCLLFLGKPAKAERYLRPPAAS
jgi:hypothetical protein